MGISDAEGKSQTWPLHIEGIIMVSASDSRICSLREETCQRISTLYRRCSAPTRWTSPMI
jgi:hypothetical protein